MICRQCGAEVPDQEWNCPACRINVYWAYQHLDDLTEVRGRSGLAARPNTPSFLLSCSKHALEERAARVARIPSKVREIARRAMREGGRA
jgi:hypothetical protein